MNSRGELVYSRERDEPEPRKCVSRRVAEQMNQMMHKVVTEGPGKSRARLHGRRRKDRHEHRPEDIWFVGFTGKYVGGVWFGNDDNRPMAHGNTGGQIAAPVWHQFMTAAHRGIVAPTIPGLQPTEAQRVAEARRREQAAANAAAAAAAAGAGRRTASIMPDPTREALKRIAQAMRRANGAAELQPGAAPERRAETVAPRQDSEATLSARR